MCNRIRHAPTLFSFWIRQRDWMDYLEIKTFFEALKLVLQRVYERLLLVTWRRCDVTQLVSLVDYQLCGLINTELVVHQWRHADRPGYALQARHALDIRRPDKQVHCNHNHQRCSVLSSQQWGQWCKYSSGVVAKKGAPNFGLSKNCQKIFVWKCKIRGWKLPLFEKKFKGKICALVISAVGNLQLSVGIPTKICNVFRKTATSRRAYFVTDEAARCITIMSTAVAETEESWRFPKAGGCRMKFPDVAKNVVPDILDRTCKRRASRPNW